MASSQHLQRVSGSDLGNRVDSIHSTATLSEQLFGTLVVEVSGHSERSYWGKPEVKKFNLGLQKHDFYTLTSGAECAI
jgi:hypothetical protein